MIHQLVAANDPILKTRLEPFDFNDPPVDPVELARDLAETMLHYGGIGLAANQVGLPYRCFAIKCNPILVCFNPKIVDHSEDEIYLEEGCLTYPNLFVKIKRPQVIRARFTMPNGETITQKYQDLTARIFQHELDHLNGIVFTIRANKIHLEQARNKARRLKK